MILGVIKAIYSNKYKRSCWRALSLPLVLALSACGGSGGSNLLDKASAASSESSLAAATNSSVYVHSSSQNLSSAEAASSLYSVGVSSTSMAFSSDVSSPASSQSAVAVWPLSSSSASFSSVNSALSSVSSYGYSSSRSFNSSFSSSFSFSSSSSDRSLSSHSSSSRSSSSSFSSYAPVSSSSSSMSSSSAVSARGCSGHATRYWDCCKGHCGWTANVPEGVNILPSCDANDDVIFSNTPDMVKSSCDGGTGYMCHSMAPWQVTESLSYGFAAVPGVQNDICGRCYELRFDGTSYNGGDDPGSKALKDKRMIVQATNIGYDVAGGQFDILVPGGGVGAFNACTDQWGVSNDELGVQYGGMLMACKQELGWNATHASYKNCLAQRCDVFSDRGLDELYEGCMWYVNFFEAADNPSLKYHEVACPDEIIIASGVDRSFKDDISLRCY